MPYFLKINNAYNKLHNPEWVKKRKLTCNTFSINCSFYASGFIITKADSTPGMKILSLDVVEFYQINGL